MTAKPQRRSPRSTGDGGSLAGKRILGFCLVVVGCLVWMSATVIETPRNNDNWMPLFMFEEERYSVKYADDTDSKDAPLQQTDPNKIHIKRAARAPLPPDVKDLSMKKFLGPSKGQLECLKRPPHIQKMIKQRRKEGKTLIYYHDGPSAGAHVPFIEWFFPGNQTHKYCYDCETTTDEQRAIEADAIVVLYRKKWEYWASGQRPRVPPKYCGQLFVFVQTECPNNIDPKFTPSEKHEEAKVFDISSTYRLDSDLPRPYNWDMQRTLKMGRKTFVPVEKRQKEFPATWIASRCDTTNLRMGYVEELMKHINIHSYGKCLNNAQMKVDRKSPNWKEAADAQIAGYKFYLAFENSNCDYYVTEKLYRALAMGLIPVVMGAPQAHLWLPNNHSALFVKDFESPAALAKRMHEINDDDDLFRHYTSHLLEPEKNIDDSFRSFWFRKRAPQACQLCDFIRDARKNNRTKFKGVPFEHWKSCEQVHGTWKTKFKPLKTENGVVPRPRIVGH